MTAAHCAVDCSQGHVNVKVIVGAHDVDNKKEGYQTIEAEGRCHENYDPKTKANDISLLKLKTPVNDLGPGGKAKIICIPEDTSSMPSPGTSCYVTGWGSKFTALTTDYVSVMSFNCRYFRHPGKRRQLPSPASSRRSHL